VRWSARDPDHDPLQATVEYSANDGRTFRPVFIGRSTGRVVLPARLFAASRAARVRVTVNDGFNQTASLSRRFVSLGSPPTVQIVAAPRGTVRNDALVNLSATAFDGSGHRLPSRAFQWRAGKRVLGRGAGISPLGLPSGRVRVVVAARDAGGRVGTASLVLRVRAMRPVLRVLRALHARAGARKLVLLVSTSISGTLTLEGRRYRVGTATRRLAVALKHPLRTGRALPLVLRAGSKKRAIRLTALPAKK
jgi:hypothetical protein